MVNLKEVRASNAIFSKVKKSQVALFVGATSGIGEGTLMHYVKNAYAPTVYIVGRSKPAAIPQLEKLAKSNPDATLKFIEIEISLIRNVDNVCKEVESKEKKLDLLFMSPGYLSFQGRNESSEGIDISYALRYYSRLRFVDNLLLLLNASPAPRVVSILAGGKEVNIDFDDLEMKNNFDGLRAAAAGATLTTLAFEELVKTNPKVTFIHKFPGFVHTGVVDRLFTTATGIWYIPATIARWTVVPIISLFFTSADVAGERGLFVATSDLYSTPRLYLLNAVDEIEPGAPIMTEYRADGSSAKVWEDTQGVWNRALASSSTT